jgi:hypothetical protein
MSIISSQVTLEQVRLVASCMLSRCKLYALSLQVVCSLVASCMLSRCKLYAL